MPGTATRGRQRSPGQPVVDIDDVEAYAWRLTGWKGGGHAMDTLRWVVQQYAISHGADHTKIMANDSKHTIITRQEAQDRLQSVAMDLALAGGVPGPDAAKLATAATGGEVPVDDEKILMCKDCHLPKRAGDFHRDRSTKTGRRATCKKCTSDRRKERLSEVAA